jgi:hypothetical protein
MGRVIEIDEARDLTGLFWIRRCKRIALIKEL